MNSIVFLAVCLFFLRIDALEYVKQFENDKVSVAYVKITPYEEIGLHYDEYESLVIALKGGIITRLEADGSKTKVVFPTGKTIFRPSETADKLHKSVNASSDSIELIIVQLK